MKPRFFKNPADLRKWFDKNHDSAAELLIGFYKKDSGKQSITWPESVDEALCVGWIDGIRRSLDEVSYTIRFTPRRKRSIWSAVNIKRAQELIDQRRMRAPGLKAFAARNENRSGIYAYEQRSSTLPAEYEKILKKNKAAWKFLQDQPPYYRKLVSWYVTSAMKEETRIKRLNAVVEQSAKHQRIGQFSRDKK